MPTGLLELKKICQCVVFGSWLYVYLSEIIFFLSYFFPTLEFRRCRLVYWDQGLKSQSSHIRNGGGRSENVTRVSFWGEICWTRG